jgi:hypothetical protein
MYRPSGLSKGCPSTPRPAARGASSKAVGILSSILTAVSKLFPLHGAEKRYNSRR